MIYFIVGLVIGACIGVLLAAVCVVGDAVDKHIEYLKYDPWIYETKYTKTTPEKESE